MIFAVEALNFSITAHTRNIRGHVWHSCVKRDVIYVVCTGQLAKREDGFFGMVSGKKTNRSVEPCHRAFRYLCLHNIKPHLSSPASWLVRQNPIITRTTEAMSHSQHWAQTYPCWSQSRREDFNPLANAKSARGSSVEAISEKTCPAQKNQNWVKLSSVDCQEPSATLASTTVN